MYERRLSIILAITSAVYLVAFVQLVRIQVVHAERYRLMAERKYTWDELTAAGRGRIVDRRGRVLAVNRPSYDLAARVGELELKAVTPGDIDEIVRSPGLTDEERELEHEAAIERLATTEPMVVTLAEMTGADAAKIASGLYDVMADTARWGVSPHPLTFLHDIPFEPWVRIKVAQEPPEGADPGSRPYPGLAAVHSARRAYPVGDAACHILGYVGEFDAEQWASLRHAGCIVWQGRRKYRQWNEVLEGLSASNRSEALDLIADEIGEVPVPDALSAKLRAIAPARRARVAEDICGAAVIRGIRVMGPEQRERLYAALGDSADEVRSWLEEPDRLQLTSGEYLWVGRARHLKDRTVGMSGVEAVQNERLRGRHGYKMLVRILASSGYGGELDYLHQNRPVNGADVRLTIDLEFQQSVEGLLRRTGRRGAAVFLDPNDGAVLAMASTPAYSPDLFVPPRKPGAALLVGGHAPGEPLLNRAIQGEYPPGSVFKPFVAAAALHEVERTGLTPAATLLCQGQIQSGPRTFHSCEGIHGEIALREAIARSCNIYFYKAGAKLGVDGLSAWSRLFGFGEPSGVDLTGEARGLVPSREWKRAELGRPWYSAETYHFSIGQGYLTVTPLQVARAMGALASGGELWRPYIAEGFGSTGPERRLSLESHILKAIREGMEDTTRKWYGTAFGAFGSPLFPKIRSFNEEFPEIKVAGKTGSAEHSRSRGGRTHAWFAGFAPGERPKVAFAIILEEGGYGGHAAAPLAAEMLARYFRIFGKGGHR